LADWTILITNLAPDQLSPEEAGVLARARWQIELLFKLWKQHGHLALSRSQQPWRIVAEVYAKLIALIIQHWLLVSSVWGFPDKSLVKAAHVVRSLTVLLASTLDQRSRLTQALRQLDHTLQAGCRLNPRRRRPSTYQLLLDPTLGGLS
jgi:IS4 transposase